MMKFKAILSSVVAIAITLFAFSSCEKQQDFSKDLPGYWELTSISGNFEQMPEVFMSFTQDGAFTIWQRFGSNTSFVRYDGSWTLAGDQLSGKYSDGSAWASGYKIEIDGGVLFMSASAAAAAASSEASTYRKISQLPADLQESHL